MADLRTIVGIQRKLVFWIADLLALPPVVENQSNSPNADYAIKSFFRFFVFDLIGDGVEHMDDVFIIHVRNGAAFIGSR